MKTKLVALFDDENIATDAISSDAEFRSQATSIIWMLFVTFFQ